MRVVLIAGGNQGDMKTRLRQAQTMINDRVGPVMRCSHRYESEAWGFSADKLFTNQVMVVDTELSPREVLAQTQAIERELGRDKQVEQQEKAATGQPYASRPMDIDILYYGEQTVDEPDLKIPHPHIAERDFVLAPLRELGLYKG
jgi:2-amino-4-hydroxy-6-hydroxymethyldihydropteridine diphosphokinase